MQSASAERTVGLLRPSRSVSVATAPPKHTRKSPNIIFAPPPFFAPTLLENRRSDRNLGAFAVFAVRRHQETEEGEKRAVNTDERNY